MDHDSFTNLVEWINGAHGSAQTMASLLVGPLLLMGASCGLRLVIWIFRGGLSRSGFGVLGQEGTLNDESS